MQDSLWASAHSNAHATRGEFGGVAKMDLAAWSGACFGPLPMNTEIKRSDSASKENPVVTPIVKPVESKKSETPSLASSDAPTSAASSEPTLAQHAASWIDEVSTEAIAFENRLQELVREKPLVALAGAAVVGFVTQSILGRRSREA